MLRGRELYMEDPIDSGYGLPEDKVLLYGISPIHTFYYEANYDILDTNPTEQLLYSITINDVDKFNKLIELDIDLNFYHLLLTAILESRFEMAKKILIKTLERLETSIDEIYLRECIEYDNFPIAKLLLEFGANVSDNDYAPLKQAAEYSHDIFKLFTDYEPYSIDNKFYYENALLRACTSGQFDNILLMYNIGVDMHVFNDDLLSIVSYHGYVDIVKFFLELDLNIHGQDDRALRYASIRGHSEIVKLLLEYGANIYAKDNYSIKMATYNNHFDVVKILLSCDSNLVSVDNNYFLKCVCENGHNELLKLFIEYGINIPTDNNYINIACMEGHLEIIKTLIIANPQLSISKCTELLNIARKYNEINIVNYLMNMEIESNN